MALGGVLFSYVVTPAVGKPLAYTLFLKFGKTAVGMDYFFVLMISIVAGVLLGALASWYMASIQGLPEHTRRARLIIALVVFLLIFPFFEQITNMQWIAAVITAQIFILLALGLNIVVGYAGLLDLGYAAFFAIGAYTAGLLNSPQIDISWNFWLVIWIAAAVGSVAGLALGAPTLRLRGDYLAIVTLGFGEIVPVVFRNLTTVTLREPITRICFVGCDPVKEVRNACLYACTGPLDLSAGERGINPIGRPVIPFAPDNLFGANYLPWYFLILVLILFSIFLIRRMHQSRIGRAWMAIREDELAASQMGIDPVKTKLMALPYATFPALPAFYGSYISAIFPGVFDFTVSVIVLCMVILGGLGNMVGVIIGGILIMGTDRLSCRRWLPCLKVYDRHVCRTSVTPPSATFFTFSLDPIHFRLMLFGLVLVI